MADNFETFYVKIAEATAASRDSLTASPAFLGDSSGGNVETIVDVTTISFTEENISEVQFEVDNLNAANSTWTQMLDLATANSPYNPIVTSLNNFVINNVLGIDNYSTTLQAFIDDDCNWDSDPSAGAGAPTSWIQLMQAAGFDVVDTHPDNA